jgi:hypothetical protein
MGELVGANYYYPENLNLSIKINNGGQLGYNEYNFNI